MWVCDKSPDKRAKEPNYEKLTKKERKGVRQRNKAANFIAKRNEKKNSKQKTNQIQQWRRKEIIFYFVTNPAAVAANKRLNRIKIHIHNTIITARCWSLWLRRTLSCIQIQIYASTNRLFCCVRFVYILFQIMFFVSKIVKGI